MAKFTKSIFTFANKVARKLLSGAQKLFNTKVQTGEFDLRQLIDDSPWAKVKGINNEARKWIQEYSKDKDVQYNKKFMEAGKLYHFRYINPKHKDTLDYWDKGPLVLCLGGYWSKAGDWIEMGLNLHLLPPNTRRKVLEKIFDMYSNKYKGEMYAPYQRPLEINWKKIAKPLLVYGAGFCFRSYIPKRRTMTIEFRYEDWDKAIYVPNEYLTKTTEQELTDLWQKFMLNKSLRDVSGFSLDQMIGNNY